MNPGIPNKVNLNLQIEYTKHTKVFVHVPTVPHGRNMHSTSVISTEDNIKRFKLKIKYI